MVEAVPKPLVSPVAAAAKPLASPAAAALATAVVTRAAAAAAAAAPPSASPATVAAAAAPPSASPVEAAAAGAAPEPVPAAAGAPAGSSQPQGTDQPASCSPRAIDPPGKPGGVAEPAQQTPLGPPPGADQLARPAPTPGTALTPAHQRAPAQPGLGLSSSTGSESGQLAPGSQPQPGAPALVDGPPAMFIVRRPSGSSMGRSRRRGGSFLAAADGAAYPGSSGSQQQARPREGGALGVCSSDALAPSAAQQQP